MIPDVNVLVAVSRSDHPHHGPALTWLDAALDECEKGRALALFPMVAASFLRLVTHPKVLVRSCMTPFIDEAKHLLRIARRDYQTFTILRNHPEAELAACAMRTRSPALICVAEARYSYDSVDEDRRDSQEDCAKPI